MKLCSDPKYKLVFSQLVRQPRNLVEKRFRRDTKYTFIHSSELKTDLNNSYRYNRTPKFEPHLAYL